MKDFLTKKNFKRIIMVLGMVALAFVVTGCTSVATGGHVAPISHTSGSWWDRYVLYYLSEFILWIASLVHNSYGWAIIIFTIIIRVILLPLNAIQIKSMGKQQRLQPQMDALRKKYSGKDVETRQKLQEETSKLYKEAGVNPYVGCLPLLIQLPVMWALYQSIYRTPQLQNGHFLWMDLGHPDPYFVMPILAAVFTFMSSYISQMSQPKSSQNGMTKSMTYIMPIFIGVTAVGLQSAISLYWVVSNLFQVVQTFILQNPFKYQRELEEEKKAEQERQKRLRKTYKRLGRKKSK
ncbi:membrane protein insertase YidC [Lactobacillus sp.]|uniref:membrane protein insertase YidC n=1 Tax=Lactobacillus sp. TaxID=1591 RepID=UPI001992EBA6|nr:membrane protein insertase YidC [Lactobacillus sp.]MBD5429483.1 membrane protein insertase YidC [Lactobacillus sp.]